MTQKPDTNGELRAAFAPRLLDNAKRTVHPQSGPIGVFMRVTLALIFMYLIVVSYMMFGHKFKIPVPDIDRCHYFLALGANPLVSNGSMMGAPNVKARLRAIQKRGGKVVLLDPRRTETAAIADRHLFIRLISRSDSQQPRCCRGSGA